MAALAPFFAAVLAFGVQAREGLVVREPTPADLWRQTFEIRCGRETLVVRGYGTARPGRGEGPRIESNGRPVSGDRADALRADLSRQAAVYRLSGQCLPRGRGIWFRIHSGEMVYPGERPPGRRVFHAGAAIIRRGRIQRYSGLEPVSEEQFWFR